MSEQEQTSQALLAQGEAHLAQGDFRAADAALRSALDAAETPLARADVLDGLVRLGLDVGEDLAAAQWLSECEALRTEHAGPLSPAAGRTWALRAQFHQLADSDPQRASGAWERAVRLLDGQPRRRALLGLGRCRSELAQHEAAERVLTEAADGADDALLAQVEEALARLRLAQGQLQRALGHVHRRVGLVHGLHGPDSLEAANTLMLLAAIAETDNDLESAVSALDRAVHVLGGVLGPEDTETMMAAAYLMALRSRLAGAPQVPDSDPD